MTSRVKPHTWAYTILFISKLCRKKATIRIWLCQQQILLFVTLIIALRLNYRSSTQSLCALISWAVPSSKKPIRCRAFLLFILFVTVWPWTLTPWPWPLTFDLWPWTFVVSQLCRSETLSEIWAQSANPRRSYCSLNFDLMTLNMYHVLCCALRYFTQSLNSVKIKLSVHEMWRYFHANMSYHAMTLTFDPLTLKVCGRSGGM